MASSQEHGALALPHLSPPPRVLIVAAPFYRAAADGLVAGARAALDAAGATHELIEVPGALEIPVAIRLAAESGVFEGYVALGCVIRGETTHYDTVCTLRRRRVPDSSCRTALAIGNGILTCENMDQAAVRADPGEMDKGGGAAAAALHLIALARHFRGLPNRGSAVPGDADILLAAAANQPRTA